MSRYTESYDPYRDMGQVSPAGKKERMAGQKASGSADIMRMLAQVAPFAGAALGGTAGLALGGPGGAMLGGQIGAGAGQMAGGVLGAGAESTERPYLERQQARDRQIEMLLSALGRSR